MSEKIRADFMKNASFRLCYNKHRVKTDNTASLYLQVIIDRQVKRFNQRLTWPVDKIDSEAVRLLPRFKNDTECRDYNLIIEVEKKRMIEIFVMYRLQNLPFSVEILEKELKTFDQTTSFLGYMKNEITRRFNRSEIEDRTYKNHLATMKVLQSYDCECKFASITKSWLERFRTFLLKHTQNGRPYKVNTVWGHIKNVSTYLKLASKEPLINFNYEAVKIKNSSTATPKTFLVKEEVSRFINFLKNEAQTVTEANVARAFCFACLTSFRISDLKRVNRSYLVDDNFLEFIQHKGRKKGKLVRVPIMQMVKDLVDVRSYEPWLPMPTEQEYNRTLKDIAKRLGIKKKVTSHTARHTFGYLYMAYVGNIKALQEIMGHSKLETTMIYANLNDDYKLNSLKLIESEFYYK